MKKINFIFIVFFVASLFLASNYVSAEGESVNLSLKKGGVAIFNGSISLPGSGMAELLDTKGNSHPVDARSVLSIVSNGDSESADFEISNLMYYSSFSAFYLKCIQVNLTGEELCDNWQYKVDGENPSVGMDQEILSGGENIVLFFGSDDPILEPEPALEEPKVEEKPPERQSSSGSRSRRSNKIAKPIVEEKIEVVLPPVEVLPIPEVVVEPNVAKVVETIKKVEPEKIVEKPVSKIASPAVNVEIKNEAAVIASQGDNSAPDVSPDKKSWFRAFLGWLFGI